MMINILKSKIHRATITQANLDYEGSVTIDAKLMKLAKIIPYEAVHIWNVSNGSRLVTYAIEGPEDSGVICINGAAAHLNFPSDLVILATFINLTHYEAEKWSPTVLRVDKENKPINNSLPEIYNG